MAIREKLLPALIEERSRTEPFRFVLRRKTRAEHEALDSHPAFADLMNGTLDIAGYRRLMLLFHGFYASHDRILQDACDAYALHRSGFAYASRMAFLDDDLASLGVDCCSMPMARPSADLFPVGSAASLGGMLYVFEGSMLGGAMLCRATEAVLGGASGNAYWRWCRDAGPARWAMTCSLLENLAGLETARADMVAGAQAGFRSFADWLAAWHDHPREAGASAGSVARC